ncbi:ABC transporter ATP-binding protein [Candidatus Gracilibacteria bacterium]|nr:ABC transporter ATP-binding protein [Candidatus Gracilibacteria bacterium]
MNYKLSTSTDDSPKKSMRISLRRIIPFLSEEKGKLILTFCMVILSTISNLVSPMIIGNTIDTSIQSSDYHGVFMSSLWLLLIYIIGSLASYIQTKTMGGVGRRLLFNIRNTIFNKIQELPIAFFDQNKTGDLISRINNDTDKLNQFISQTLMQFFSNFFLIFGTGIFILFLHFDLSVVTLLPALGVLLITQLLSPWIKKKNLQSLQALGGLSATIQENLSSFKVIIAFNRLDYFKKKFDTSNLINYQAGIGQGISSSLLIPIYGFAGNIALLLSLWYGIHLITNGSLTIGLLISFQLYLNNFYSPLRQLASVWSSLQLSLASLERVGEILDLQSNMQVSDEKISISDEENSILEFKNVSFHYPDGENIVTNTSFSLEKGKTYAFIGPTGGGKTTTASLIARLYDPTEGVVYLDGKDIRSYQPNIRTCKIGFILQEPFLFSGTIRDNIIYGNSKYSDISDKKLIQLLKKHDLYRFVTKFEGGLNTVIDTSGESMSLGQKQLIAFIRAFLRQPDILILDEATANIDTVTEQILEEILGQLPKTTTKVIIAHRLNTIKNADEIFFINSGNITPTGSMENAINMLLYGERKS